MTLIKIYVALWFVSILLWPSVWTADRFIVPILPFIIIFVARGMIGAFWRNVSGVLDDKTVNNSTSPKLRIRLVELWVQIPPVILLAILLLNAVYIGGLAFKQINDNIRYIKGDHYAGYPDEYRQFFSEIARLEGLPDSTVVVCRKPEFVYLLTGRACVRATTEVEQ